MQKFPNTSKFNKNESANPFLSLQIFKEIRGGRNARRLHAVLDGFRGSKLLKSYEFVKHQKVKFHNLSAAPLLIRLWKSSR